MMPEPLAQRILAQALVENRAAELLECLFEGGSATVDASTGALVLLPGTLIEQALSHVGDQPHD